MKLIKKTKDYIHEKIESVAVGRFLLSLFGEMQKDRVPELAANMTYYLLLALFPFLIFLLGVFSYTPLSIEDVTSVLTSLLPAQTVALILETVREVLENENIALFSFAMLATIWSTTRGAKALITGVNRAYGVKETRSFFITRVIAIFVIIGIPLFALVSFVLLVMGELLLHQFADWFQLSMGLQSTISTLRYIVTTVMLIFFFTLFYLFVPNLRLSFKKVIVGAVFTTLGWITVSMLFSYYINNFANYTKVYGSLGSIIALLLWLNLSSMIILIGAEINMLVDWGSKDETIKAVYALEKNN